MQNKRSERMIRVDTPARNFFWFLMLIGLIIIVFFTINLVFNFIFAIDLAGDGVNVVQKEAVVEGNQVISEAETAVLHGFSGWVENFAPWLALNAFYLVLGTLIFGLGYAMTMKKEDRIAVSLYKMRILGTYLATLSLLMLILGVDRVYFIPHGAKTTAVAWTNWYILEPLAHIIWAIVLAVLAVFLLRVRRAEEDGSNE